MHLLTSVRNLAGNTYTHNKTASVKGMSILGKRLLDVFTGCGNSGNKEIPTQIPGHRNAVNIAGGGRWSVKSSWLTVRKLV